jgi:phosphoribosylformylglycinamidine synthase
LPCDTVPAASNGRVCAARIKAALRQSSEKERDMKVRVDVMLKQGVLDPQGEAVRHALGALGFDGVSGVRQGKVIELDLADGTSEDSVREMCEKLLANTVIESYSITTL